MAKASDAAEWKKDPMIYVAARRASDGSWFMRGKYLDKAWSKWAPMAKAPEVVRPGKLGGGFHAIADYSGIRLPDA